MRIAQITDRQKNTFNRLSNHPVQSWEWGELRKKAGNKVARIGIWQGKRLREACQLTIHKIPYTNFSLAMFAKGPAPTAAMIKALKQLAREENLIFIRLEPNVSIKAKGAERMLRLLKEKGAKPGRPFFNKSTFSIDLTLTEKELQKRMHPKTRYNIRVATRHGVEVVEDNSNDAFEHYLDLMDETTRRQKYFAHTEKYHRLMWETLRLAPLRSGQAPIAYLLNARYQGKTLITWILFIWKKTLYYPYGASSKEDRSVMPAYKMMWEAILFGKKLGLESFDLWGRDESKGFTRFKEGFAPEIIEFLGTRDLVINPQLYFIYRLIEELRWKFLKLRAKIVPLSSFR